MQAIAIHSPVSTAPSFASARFRQTHQPPHIAPQCQFGGGKVPSFNLFQRLVDFWWQVKFIVWNTLKRTGLTKDVTTHNHEIGHALAQYTSGLKPLGISVNETKAHDGFAAGYVLNRQLGSRLSVQDHIKGIWNDLAGAMFGEFKILKNMDIEVSDSALHQMSNDFGKASDSLKKLGFKDGIIETIRKFSEKFEMLNPTHVKADKTGKLQAQFDETFKQYHPESLKFISYKPIMLAFQKLYELKTLMKSEKLDQLRKGLLNKDGWMFGKTFRTQLYEKVFTPAERQQFEKIYQEFEREFLALPEVQALGKQPS